MTRSLYQEIKLTYILFAAFLVYAHYGIMGMVVMGFIAVIINKMYNSIMIL